jgi:hypothetical protein
MKAEKPPLDNYHLEGFDVGFGFPGFEPIPVVSLDEETLVSRWRPTPEELEMLTRTGELYVLHAKGVRVLPIRLQVERPEWTLPVLQLDLGEAGRSLCHGLEVREAEGSEADRLDYAVAEVVAEMSARAALPCRVALLKPGAVWKELGGEECLTRAQLEAGLTLRLKKALDVPESHVEARDAAGGSYRIDVVEMTPRECVASGDGEGVAARI